MSADGNVKIALSPSAAVPAKKPSASVNVPQVKRVCGFCQLPLGAQPPVLLKSGRSLHLECYLLIRKRSVSKRLN